MIKTNNILFSVILALVLSFDVHAADVENEVVRQEGNRGVFAYDVEGQEEETEVTITLTVTGKTYTAEELHLEGDTGKVKTGKGKKIDWEIKAEGRAAEGMILVKGGCFQMGDTFGDGESDEKPVHEVCVDGIYMDMYEVTQKAYREEMGKSPSHFKGDDNPVENVTWHDAKQYCEKAGKRLPTEAEWENAARSGGKREKYAGTSSDSELGEYAWYNDNSGNKTHPVGQKKPNGVGLYDMSGNVWEWVEDWYDSIYYKNSPMNNPKGPDSGDGRVLRSSSWGYDSMRVRSANRDRYYPDGRNLYLGFRCARTY